MIKAGPKHEVLATNQLDEGFMASAAVSGESLIVRTVSHLYRIEDRQNNRSCKSPHLASHRDFKATFRLAEFRSLPLIRTERRRGEPFLILEVRLGDLVPGKANSRRCPYLG